MSLAPGTLLGHYEILAPIGKGGMGEVYRGRDTRLGRDVAIKVSSARFSERFEREARAIAALNHPNICTLYDVGPNYLVMEYIEGEAPKGPMELEAALRIASQIAAALREAHEKRITHRDLKPANIKIRADGLVKVLDFGLAKIAPEPVALSEDSPTLTMGGTVAGTILGTAAYMSPEQARGKDVDKRSDIWSFGVVLYELLTGTRPFKGEDLGETLASVVKEPVDLTPVPERARRLIARCLEKDPQKRLQDIGDHDLLLVDEPAPVSIVAPPATPRRWLWALAAVPALALAALAWVHFRQTQAPRQAMRFEVDAPEGTGGTTVFAISPDGKTLAMRAGTADQLRIYLRSMETGQSRLFVDGQNRQVYWSSDSRSLILAGGPKNNIARVDLDGGVEQPLCPVPEFTSIQASWAPDGTILYNGPSGIHAVPARGGECKVVAALDTKRGELSASRPSILPDGRHFLYHRQFQDRALSGVYIGSIDAKPSEQSAEVLMPDPPSPNITQYVPPLAGTAAGYIVFFRSGTLFAQEFDASSLKLVGDAIPIANNAANSFSVSSTGILVHRTSDFGLRQLTWLDQSGKETGTLEESGASGHIRFSHKGSRVAFRNGANLWVHDRTSGVTSQMTSGERNSQFPVWSPDDTRIAYQMGETIFVRPADLSAPAKALWEGQEAVTKFTMDWSPDGRYILYNRSATSSSQDLYVAPLDPPGAARPLVATPATEGHGRFSPDGRYLAYTSNEGGETDVYVRPFTAEGTVGAPVKISQGGGTQPLWRKSGGELYYIQPGGAVVAVELNTSAELKRGPARELFKSAAVGALIGGGPAHGWDVAPDGRFLILSRPQEARATTLTVIVNWQEILKRR